MGLGLTSQLLYRSLDKRVCFSSLVDGRIGIAAQHQQIYELALDFAKEEMEPNMSKWDENEIFPIDTLKKAAKLGFAGIYTKSDVGGANLGRIEASLIFEALAQGCVSTAAFLSIQNMCAWMIDNFGNQKQREKYLSSLVKQEKIASYCLTEPGSGSDAASLTTMAKKDGDYFVLNGSKAFISGAGVSDTYLIMARTGEPNSGAKGITAFIVEKQMNGLGFGKKEKKMGWNSQPTAIVNLENVRVPHENVLGGIGEGFKIAMKGITGGRINIASCSLGAARAAIQKTIEYTKDRTQFKTPIIEFQTSQFKVADMVTKLLASRLLVHKAAQMLDEESPLSPAYSAMAKKYATENCFDICNQALQLHGGYGYLKDYAIQQYFRDCRVHQILEGTNEVMQILIARELLK